MDVKRISAGACWFTAACLAVLAFVLVLAGITANPGEHWSTAGLVLAILAGAALAAMIAVMSIAFRSERRDDTDRTRPGSP